MKHRTIPSVPRWKRTNDVKEWRNRPRSRRVNQTKIMDKRQWRYWHAPRHLLSREMKHGCLNNFANQNCVQPAAAATYRSPTDTCLTSAPASFTTPTNWWPRITDFEQGTFPATTFKSVPQIAEYVILTTRSWGLWAWGTGLVMMESCPSHSCTALFMIFKP